MRKAGPSAGALVVDLLTGRELFAARPDNPRAPASVEKLYTTAAALARFGPDARLQTAVAGVGSPDDRGIWHGDLFLKGGGDPTFDILDSNRLAQQVVDAGIVAVRGRVIAAHVSHGMDSRARRAGGGSWNRKPPL